MKLNELKNKVNGSKNPELAKNNLDFLISNKRLTPETISQVFAITESINDNRSAISSHYKKHYGFEGGKLTNDTLNEIIKRKYKDDMLAIMMIAAY